MHPRHDVQAEHGLVRGERMRLATLLRRRTQPSDPSRFYRYCAACNTWQVYTVVQHQVNGAWTRCVNCKQVKWVDA